MGTKFSVVDFIKWLLTPGKKYGQLEPVSDDSSNQKAGSISHVLDQKELIDLKSPDSNNERAGRDIAHEKQLSKISRRRTRCNHAKLYYGVLERHNKTYEAVAEPAALNSLNDVDASWTIDSNDYEKARRRALNALGAFKYDWGQIVQAQAWAVQHTNLASEAHEADTDVARELCSRFPAVGVTLLALHQAAVDRIKWSMAALEVSENLGNKSLQCIHLNHLGLSYTELGDYETALEYYERAIAVAHGYPDAHRFASKANINLALTYARAGEYKAGIDYGNRAINEINAIAKKGDNLLDIRRDEVKAHNLLGELYRSQREIRKAVEHSNKALALAQKIGDFRSHANALGSLGNIYLKLSSGSYYDPDNAIHHYEQALAVYDQHGDTPGMISAHTMLGEAFRNQRRFDEAQEQFDHALKIAIEYKNPFHLAGVHYHMVLLYMDLGEREKPLHHAQAAHKFFQEIDSRQMIQVTWNLIQQLR